MNRSSIILVLKLSKDEEDRIRKPKRRCLIIKLLGRKVGFQLLEQKLLQLWRGIGIFKLMDLDNGFYLVKFSNIEDQDYMLIEGPKMIFDHYLTIQEWF